jgi:hypothetical protein
MTQLKHWDERLRQLGLLHNSPTIPLVFLPAALMVMPTFRGDLRALMVLYSTIASWLFRSKGGSLRIFLEAVSGQSQDPAAKGSVVSEQNIK